MTKSKSNNKTLSETKQVGKFGLVGVLNTLLDFSIYNILIIYLDFDRIPANIVAASFAMTFSFFANKTFVFGNKSRNTAVQALIFLLVTAFGLYILQNIVIFSLTEVWRWPLKFAYDIVGIFGLDRILSESFVIDNGAKAIATLFSMTWNYLMYKKVVFKK